MIGFFRSLTERSKKFYQMTEAFVGLFDPGTEELEDEELSSSCRTLLDEYDCLPPECAEGNIEYKLKLINPSQSRFEHLVTQMKWRLREGMYDFFEIALCTIYNGDYQSFRPRGSDLRDRC